MRALDRYRYRSRFSQYNLDTTGPSAYDRAYSDYLSSLFIKAFAASPIYSGFPQFSSAYDEAEIANTPREIAEKDDDMRRAISPISNYFNTLGMYRSGFSKDDNDVLANNAYFSVAEKAMMDYLSTLKYVVVDKKEEEVEDAMNFIRYPNPQDSFGDIVKATLPDLLRYDAAVIAQSFNNKGYAIEMKPYLGTEFWKEIDRSIKTVNAGERTQMMAYYSAGYTRRFWQRSRTGLYVSFQPDEIAYMMMYPKSDSVYGTDFISRLKWQIQYLIDSTRAAGKTFANGVVPSIVWKHPQIFDRNQLRQRMEEVRTENQGSYRFGSILHLVRDEDVMTLSHTLHDMEWLEGQRFVAQLVWAMWGFQPEEFIGQSVNRACYSEDTEVLTENGWKLHKDVLEGERIAIYDKDSQECRLEIPFGLSVYPVNEDLVKFETNAQDILVTKEHTMLKQSDRGNPNSKWIVCKAHECVDKPTSLKCGIEHWEGDDIYFNPDYLRFIGWAISEGGLSTVHRERKSYVMTLCQSNSKPENVNEIRRVLDSIGAEYGEYQYEKDNTTRWNIYGKELIDPLFDDIGAYCTEKKIPRKLLNLPSNLLSNLFDAMMAGDGSWDTRENRSCGYYSTTSEQLADDFQELAFKLGYGTKKTIHYPAKGNRVTCHRVLIRKRISREVVKPKYEKYTGNVYCFTTSTGFYVTRRNGCVAVQGNTAYIGRNITKSKMLYPLVNYYEDVLNRQILPHLEGYQKDWKFKFMIEQDLDDTLKQAQILATQVQAANMMITTGVKPEQAYKIARVVDDPKTLEIEDIRMMMQQGGQGGPNGMMPKQPVKNKEGAVEGYKGASIKKIPFGDSEERQAGIKK